jgi:hypothetical protein
MKKPITILLILVLLALIALVLWPRSRSTIPTPTANPFPLGYPATVELSGTAGARFTGEYLRGGERVAISGVVPWSRTDTNISRLEIRKAKADDALACDVRGGARRQTISATAAPGTKGLKVDMEGSWSFEIIR